MKLPGRVERHALLHNWTQHPYKNVDDFEKLNNDVEKFEQAFREAEFDLDAMKAMYPEELDILREAKEWFEEKKQMLYEAREYRDIVREELVANLELENKTLR